MNQQNMQIISAAITDKGLSQKRPLNEDSYLEMTDRGLFAVADGVGGAQAGELASQTAMEVLYEAFSHPRKDVETEELLEMAIQSANTSIFQMSHELPQLDMMATTIVSLRIEGTLATIGHVGDSRAYRLDARGNLFRETQDHSMVEEEVRAGRMTAAQAANHPSRNVISRALGAESSVEVDLKTILFEPNTTFLLCSDGITRHVNDVELREILMNFNPIKACRRLKEICYERGAEDNLTAVIVALHEAETFADLTAEEEIEEEVTISNIRPAQPVETETKAFAANSILAPRGATGKLSFPANIAPVESVSSNNYGEETVETNRPAISSPQKIEVMPRDTIYDREEYQKPKSSGGLLSGLLGFLGGLVLGICLGAGLLYGWLAFTSTPTKVTELPKDLPKTSTVAFAESVQLVDADPTVAIARYKGDTATEAYFRGRARVQLGEYDKAFEELKKASDLLKTDAPSEINKETLKTEVMLALATVSAKLPNSEMKLEATKIFDEWVKAKSNKAKVTGGEANVSVPKPN